jgi:hypothetical protein
MRRNEMTICLLDNSLRVEIAFEPTDAAYLDNICISFFESCPHDEKIFLAGETHIYLTPRQANALARALLQACEDSQVEPHPDPDDGERV